MNRAQRRRSGLSSGSKVVIGLAAGGVVALLARRATGTTTPASTYGWKGPSEYRPRTRSTHYPDSQAGRDAFARDLLRALANVGLTGEPAVLFAAHLIREVGGNAYGLFNFNFGNIKAVGNPPRKPYYRLTDRLGYTDWYRAYDSLEDGIADAVAFVRDRRLFAGAWAKLQAGDPTWYGTLGLEGYYEGPVDPARPGVHTSHTTTTIVPVQREYDSIVRAVRAAVARGGELAPAPTSGSKIAAVVALGLAAAGAYAYRREIGRALGGRARRAA